MRPDRLLVKIKHGGLDNVSFRDFRRLVEACGFELGRQRGSHLWFEHPDLPVSLSLQALSGEAKPYQIRQFLAILQEYPRQTEGLL